MKIKLTLENNESKLKRHSGDREVLPREGTMNSPL
jgi:hypothetical protein